jgi:Ca2+-binding EF-hand superfamily protein
MKIKVQVTHQQTSGNGLRDRDSIVRKIRCQIRARNGNEMPIVKPRTSATVRPASASGRRRQHNTNQAEPSLFDENRQQQRRRQQRMREEHQDDSRRWRQPSSEKPSPIESMSTFECSRSKFDAWQADELLYQDSNVFQNEKSFPFHERSRRREIRQAREEERRKDEHASARNMYANLTQEVFDHSAPWAYVTRDSSGQWEPEPSVTVKPLQCKLQRSDSWHAFDKETKRRIQLRQVDEIRFHTTQLAGQNPSSGLSNMFVGSMTKLLGQLASAVAKNRLFEETVKVSLLQTMQQQAEIASKEIRELEIKSDAQVALRCDLTRQSMEWALRRGIFWEHVEPIHTTGGNEGRTRVLTTLAETTAALCESGCSAQGLMDVLLDASAVKSPTTNMNMDRRMSISTMNKSCMNATTTSAGEALGLSVLKSKVDVAARARIKAKATLRANGGQLGRGDANGESARRRATKDSLHQAPATWLRVRHVVAHCALRQSLCTGETCVASLRQLWTTAIEMVETTDAATTTSGMAMDADSIPPPTAGVLLDLTTGSLLMKALPLPLPQLVQLVEAEVHKSRRWLISGWIPSASKLVSTHLLPIRKAEGETACELWSAGVQELVARNELEARGKAKAAEAEASDVVGRRVKRAMANEGGMRSSMHARAQEEEEEKEKEEERRQSIQLAAQAEAFARKHAETKRSSIVLRHVYTDVALQKKMSQENAMPRRRQRSLTLQNGNRRSQKLSSDTAGATKPTLLVFAVGDGVVVTKSGTFHGAAAEVVNPDWEGRVQVKMESDGAVKSYREIEILKTEGAAENVDDDNELCTSMLFTDLVELYDEEERLNRKVVGTQSFHAFPLHSQQQHLQQQAARRRRKQRNQKQQQGSQKHERKQRPEQQFQDEKVHEKKRQSCEERMLRRAGLSVHDVNGYVAQLGRVGGLGRCYKKDVTVRTGWLDVNDAGDERGGTEVRKQTNDADVSGDHEAFDTVELAGKLGAGADANLAVCGAVMMVQLMELQRRSAVHLTEFAQRVAGSVIRREDIVASSTALVTTGSATVGGDIDATQRTLSSGDMNATQRTLSSKQSTELKQLFDRVDKNQDGRIDKHEMILALRQDNQNSEELRQLFRLPRHIRQTNGSLEVFERFFQELDVDDDRTLSCDELMAFFQKSGEMKVSAPSSSDQTLSIEAEAVADMPTETGCATADSGACKSASSGRHFSPNADEDGRGECVVTLSVVYVQTNDSTGTTSSAAAPLQPNPLPFVLSPSLEEVEQSMERIVSLMVDSSEAVPRVDGAVVPPLPLRRVSNAPLVEDPLGSWADSARAQLLESARSCYKNPAMQKAMSQLLGGFRGLMDGGEVRRIEGVIAKVLSGGKPVVEPEVEPEGGVSAQRHHKASRRMVKGPKAISVASSINLVRAEVERLSAIEDEINRTVPEKRYFAFFELDFGGMKTELVRRIKWLKTEMIEAAERRQYEQIEVARMQLMRADVLINQVAEIVARKFAQTEEEPQKRQGVSGTRGRSNSATRLQRQRRRTLTTEERNEKVDKSIEAGELLVALDISLFREIVPRAAALLELGHSIRGFKELRAHIELFAAIKKRRDELI